MNTKNSFQVKDLILTSALALCSIMLYWICGILGLSPYTLLCTAPVWALVSGITFFLVAVKTKSPYMMFLFCFISGLNGFSLLTVLCGLIAGVLIMWICKKNTMDNMNRLRLCYILFTVFISAGSVFMPLLFFSDQTIKQYSKSVGDSYMNIVKSLASPLVLAGVFLAIIVMALLGGWIAQKLLQKHFKKAGML